MTPARFLPREAFDHPGGYKLLPFRFTRLRDQALLVNEAGEWQLLTDEELTSFVGHTLEHHSSAYLELKAGHFLFDSSSLAPFESLVTQYRTRKSFLAGFTSLHLFVVTLRCEHACHYCQVSRVSADRTRFDMTWDTASRALDLVFRSPAPVLKIEFQGGEPLLNFPLIRDVIEAAETRRGDRTLEYVVTTNLALIDDEMLDFFRVHHVGISTSLDGPAFLHNANRPRPGGDSHKRTIAGIAAARAVLGPGSVAALMTTTRQSLDHPEDIIDEYVDRGFGAIFLRPLSPYGFAARTIRATGYSVDEFLEFYVRALDHILSINRKGYTLVESYAQLLLTRMLTPFPTGYVDLQSPSGAGIGAVVYNYNGAVYASDEGRMLAEMGDETFRLGSVHDSYRTLFGTRLRSIVEAGVAESLPGCADCAFLPWCGADPVYHYAAQGDMVGHRPTSAFHQRHDFLFRHLLTRYLSDDATRRIFWAWVTQTPVSDVLGSVA